MATAACIAESSRPACATDRAVRPTPTGTSTAASSAAASGQGAGAASTAAAAAMRGNTSRTDGTEPASSLRQTDLASRDDFNSGKNVRGINRY